MVQKSGENSPSWAVFISPRLVLWYAGWQTTQLILEIIIRPFLRIPINQPWIQWKVIRCFFRGSVDFPTINCLAFIPCHFSPAGELYRFQVQACVPRTFGGSENFPTFNKSLWCVFNSCFLFVCVFVCCSFVVCGHFLGGRGWKGMFLLAIFFGGGGWRKRVDGIDCWFYMLHTKRWLLYTFILYLGGKPSGFQVVR